jgi:DNA-binding response OmpR family regulator
MTIEITDSKILIVDDRQANIVVLEDFLEIKGYNHVKSTTDARLVLSMVKEYQPDLLLLDMMMPHFSGIEILNQLKEAKLLTDVAVLVLTADVSRETKQQALSSGANDFLTKPFDLTEVDLRIKNLLFTIVLMKQLKAQNSILDEKVKERTAELMETNKAMEAQNKQLREIAWMQSHGVRAPLARLMGLVNLLQSTDEAKDLDMTEMYQHIQNSADELDKIIREITQKTFDSELFNGPNPV